MSEETMLDGAKSSQLEEGKVETEKKDLSEFINDSS